jgi:YbbR domain-containing protein
VDMQKLGNGPDVVTGRLRVSARIAGVSEGDVQMTVRPRYISVKMEAIKTKRLPVEVKLLAAPPTDYAFTDPIVAPDSVEIQGKATQLARVSSVVLPVTDRVTAGLPAKPVNGLFSLVPTDYGGRAVKDVSLQVPRVRLKLDAIETTITKTVLVSEIVTGRPKFPAKVTNISVSPQSVTLQGRSKALAGVSTIKTSEISIEGLHESATREATLQIPPGVHALTGHRAMVTITIAPGQN